MGPEVQEAMIRQLMTQGLPHVSFGWQGGEPTLMGLDFFRRAVEWQQQYGYSGQTVANGLQTNGLLLNDEWAEFLRRYKFLVGVSLDGPPDLHDFYRRNAAGKGSFGRVMENIERLKAHRVEFNLLVVLNDRNVTQPERLWDFFLEHDLRYLQFIPCVERDPRTGKLASFSITGKQYGQFLRRTFDRWYGEGEPTLYERFFNDLLAVYCGEEHPSCLHRPECGDYVVVEHNGDVYACDFFVEPEWYLGNLLETPLPALTQTERAQSFRQRKRNLAPECRRCGWLPLCYGGCPKYRQFAGGVHRPNYLCEGYKRFYAYAHERLLALAHKYGRRPRVPLPPAELRRNDPCPCGSGRKFKKCCGR